MRNPDQDPEFSETERSDSEVVGGRVVGYRAGAALKDGGLSRPGDEGRQPGSGRTARDLTILLVLLTPSFVIAYRSLSGDAFVYLTFIRNFFELPFSFQPGTVAFGATSPLHVLVHAPVALLAGPGWIAWSRSLNFFMVAAGGLVLHRLLGGGLPSLVLVAALLALDSTLMKTAAQLFETGVLFVLVPMPVLLAFRGRTGAALFVAGVLYLARPELLIATLAFDAAIVVGESRRGRALLIAAAGLLPAALYHLYMFTMTGRIVPTSVEARAVSALEGGRTWVAGVRASVAAVDTLELLLYATAGAGAIVLEAVWWRNRRHGTGRFRGATWAEASFVLPLGIVYLAVPPGPQAPRYLLPAMPILILWAARGLRAAGSRFAAATPGLWRGRRLTPVLGGGLIAALMLAAASARAWPGLTKSRYDEDTLLQRDLVARLAPRLAPWDRILIYEIQAQYVMPAFCLSADAIVGGEAMPALRGRESWPSLMARHHVRFVVTTEAFNIRPIYRGTLLERLYAHDRVSGVGDEMEEDGLRFRKVLENPVLGSRGGAVLAAARGLNTGSTIRAYGAADTRWSGHALLWGAVYEITKAVPSGPLSPQVRSGFVTAGSKRVYGRVTGRSE